MQNLISWACRCGCGKVTRSLKQPPEENRYFSKAHRPFEASGQPVVKGWGCKNSCSVRLEDPNEDPELEHIAKELKGSE